MRLFLETPNAMTARFREHAQLAGLGSTKFTLHLSRVGAAVARMIARQDVAAAVLAEITQKSSRRGYIGQVAQPARQGATVLESTEAKYADTNELVVNLDPAKVGLFK